jgi:hypothetical protein
LLALQPDIASWRAPSLSVIGGTKLGETNFAMYLGTGVDTLPEQWRVPMEDQFDAVLYLGPPSAITFVQPSPWPCSNTAFVERLRRMALSPLSQSQAERLKRSCTQ